MTKYIRAVDMPRDVVRFFESFQEFGNLKYQPGHSIAIFEFEAADMWEARDVLESTQDALSTYFEVQLADTRPEVVGE